MLKIDILWLFHYFWEAKKYTHKICVNFCISNILDFCLSSPNPFAQENILQTQFLPWRHSIIPLTSANVFFEFQNSSFFSFFWNQREYRVTIFRRSESPTFSIVSIRRERDGETGRGSTWDPLFELILAEATRRWRLLLFSWPWQCVSRAGDSILYLPTRIHFGIPIRLSQTKRYVVNRYVCVSDVSQTCHCQWNVEVSRRIMRRVAFLIQFDAARLNVFERS